VDEQDLTIMKIALSTIANPDLPTAATRIMPQELAAAAATTVDVSNMLDGIHSND